jgi:hypothetical protein
MTRSVADALEQSETTERALSDLARRKLEAFARIEHDFMASFRFVGEVHGLRRYTTFPVTYTVRYLHSLVMCERKDLLLSVPDSGQRYEGARCLGLLRDWQEGRTAEVIAFIHHKLDGQTFAELTASIETMEDDGADTRRRRAALLAGRAILLNRLFTLGAALEAIFALDAQGLRDVVCAACAELGYNQKEIERQLAESHADIYARVAHPALARRNMLLMNHIGALVTETRETEPPPLPLAPRAAITIPGEATQLSLDLRPWP